MLKIIPFANDDDYKKAASLVDLRFYRWMMEIAISYHDNALFFENYKKHCKIARPSKRVFITYLRTKYPFLNYLIKLIRFVKPYKNV